MKETADAYYGTSEELAKVLRAEIDLHRGFAHKMLDLAQDFTVQLMLAPGRVKQDTPIGPAEAIAWPLLFDWMKEQGYPLKTDEQKWRFCRVVQEEILAANGISACISWELAHQFEHILWKD